MESAITIKLNSTTDKERSDKEQALQILARNLNRDSLVILANKSSKVGVNQKIKSYQHLI
ncbi:MAG TPA: hypothetical protein PLJ60_18275 [Chryseolinea sp.]|nr:hypothetical protein [Chryseolinea sp.]